jgi:integrase
MRLTDGLIQAMQPGERKNDDEVRGLGVSVSAKGERSFFIRYRMPPGGRAQPDKRYVIGRYGTITLKQARELARGKLADVAKGIDPMETRHSERAKIEETRVAGTLRTVIEDYLAANEKPKGAPSSYWREKRSRLMRYMAPMLAKPIGEVNKGEIRRGIARVEDESQSVAQLLFGDLRRVLNYAVEDERIKANPMVGLKGPKTVEARERVLEAHEISAFWQACGAVSWPFASVFKLLLLTGCRRDEVAGMRWTELDLDAALWTLPGARTKNKREHRVPLVETALALLNKADSEWVFSTTGHSAPSGWSKSKRALDGHMRSILGSRFRPWRLHDLRRTAATGMEDLGFPTAIVETALNHVSGAKAGIVGVYQRAEHRERVKAAFAAWETRLLDIVSGNGSSSNVVTLRKSA